MSLNPSIILVNPSLSQNIGAAARAIFNFGFQDLRLVNPKKDWLNKEARSLAAGADDVLEQAQAFDTIRDAVHDLQLIYATTARPRDLNKEVMTPHQAAMEITSHLQGSTKVGLLFGSEKCGLENDDIALTHKIITIPLSPSFTSINLAQSIVILAYEIYQAASSGIRLGASWQRQDVIAPYEDLLGLFTHLEEELDKADYFRVAHKRPVMVRSLRNLLTRAQLSTQEVRTLRGVITSLVNPQGIYSRQSKRKNLYFKETN